MCVVNLNTRVFYYNFTECCIVKEAVPLNRGLPLWLFHLWTYTYIILLACRRCEWPTCPRLSEWTHTPAGCWCHLLGLTGMAPAWDRTPGGLVLVGPGLQCGKSLGTGSHPVAQSHPWSWSRTRTRTVQQPWEAAMRPSLQRQHPTCPSPNAALPEGLLH